MSFDYINNTYGVSARRGGRIEYAPPDNEPRRGTITGTTNAYLLVRLDGEKRSLKLHPTWCVKYLKTAFLVRLCARSHCWISGHIEHTCFLEDAQRFKSKSAAQRALSLARCLRGWPDAHIEEVDL